MNDNQLAEKLYEGYCADVGGKAFNGDPLPSWEKFSADPSKQVQVNAWRKIAATARVREHELADLLTSVRSIALRKGADTAWERLDDRIRSYGIGNVTAKVFKVLPSDPQKI